MNFKPNLQIVDFQRFLKLERKILNELIELLSNDISRIFKSIAGITLNKIGENGEDSNETDNNNLKIVMNFDYNSFDNYENDNIFQYFIPFLAVAIVLIIAIVSSYFIDDGVTLKKILAQIKGHKVS